MQMLERGLSALLCGRSRGCKMVGALHNFHLHTIRHSVPAVLSDSCFIEPYWHRSSYLGRGAQVDDICTCYGYLHRETCHSFAPCSSCTVKRVDSLSACQALHLVRLFGIIPQVCITITYYRVPRMALSWLLSYLTYRPLPLSTS